MAARVDLPEGLDFAPGGSEEFGLGATQGPFQANPNFRTTPDAPSFRIGEQGAIPGVAEGIQRGGRIEITQRMEGEPAFVRVGGGGGGAQPKSLGGGGGGAFPQSERVFLGPDDLNAIRKALGLSPLETGEVRETLPGRIVDWLTGGAGEGIEQGEITFRTIWEIGSWGLTAPRASLRVAKGLIALGRRIPFNVRLQLGRGFELVARTLLPGAKPEAEHVRLGLERFGRNIAHLGARGQFGGLHAGFGRVGKVARYDVYPGYIYDVARQRSIPFPVLPALRRTFDLPHLLQEEP